MFLGLGVRGQSLKRKFKDPIGRSAKKAKVVTRASKKARSEPQPSPPPPSPDWSQVVEVYESEEIKKKGAAIASKYFGQTFTFPEENVDKDGECLCTSFCLSDSANDYKLRGSKLRLSCAKYCQALLTSSAIDWAAFSEKTNIQDPKTLFKKLETPKEWDYDGFDFMPYLISFSEGVSILLIDIGSGLITPIFPDSLISGPLFKKPFDSNKTRVIVKSGHHFEALNNDDFVGAIMEGCRRDQVSELYPHLSSELFDQAVEEAMLALPEYHPENDAKLQQIEQLAFYSLNRETQPSPEAQIKSEPIGDLEEVVKMEDGIKMEGGIKIEVDVDPSLVIKLEDHLAEEDSDLIVSPTLLVGVFNEIRNGIADVYNPSGAVSNIDPVDPNIHYLLSRTRKSFNRDCKWI